MNSFLLKISVSWNSILTEFRKAKYSTFRSVVKVSPRIEIIFQEDIFPPIFKKSYELIFPRLVSFLTTQHNLSISRVFCESRHKFLLLSSFPVFRTRWKGFDNEENNFAFFFRSLERRSRREWLKKREKSNFFHFEFQSNSRCEAKKHIESWSKRTQITFNYAYLTDLIQTLHWEGKQLG